MRAVREGVVVVVEDVIREALVAVVVALGSLVPQHAAAVGAGAVQAAGGKHALPNLVGQALVGLQELVAGAGVVHEQRKAGIILLVLRLRAQQQIGVGHAPGHVRLAHGSVEARKAHGILNRLNARRHAHVVRRALEVEGIAALAGVDQRVVDVDAHHLAHRCDLIVVVPRQLLEHVLQLRVAVLRIHDDLHAADGRGRD